MITVNDGKSRDFSRDLIEKVTVFREKARVKKSSLLASNVTN